VQEYAQELDDDTYGTYNFWHTINTIGTVEPRGADPAPRLLRVVAIVTELESGRYPPSEWVEKAPALVSGFFTPRDAAI
jgi:hypothetical protein